MKHVLKVQYNSITLGRTVHMIDGKVHCYSLLAYLIIELPLYKKLFRKERCHGNFGKVY